MNGTICCSVTKYSALGKRHYVHIIQIAFLVKFRLNPSLPSLSPSLSSPRSLLFSPLLSPFPFPIFIVNQPAISSYFPPYSQSPIPKTPTSPESLPTLTPPHGHTQSSLYPFRTYIKYNYIFHNTFSHHTEHSTRSRIAQHTLHPQLNSTLLSSTPDNPSQKSFLKSAFPIS